MGGSPGDVDEVSMTYVKQRKGSIMSCRMSRSLILKPLHRFTYVTTHSPTLPPLYLRQSSFYSPSVDSPMSQALHLCHSSFSNPSTDLSTSQLILQPLRRFTCVTGHSKTLLLLHLRHRHFTYFTWRAAHA